ncbi:S-formylglutathione hydrolase [Kangiella sp. TOML190]|uniref:S-formylglutathione hydrolase n=1 Tax=Kangiella sp. TOML190 TaxID=2931351 RepID=UPI0020418401|nr:S-formylglutathione hydrolase [Kangiella sp. TOML190]
MALELISSAKCFEGTQLRYSHYSQALNCDMNFSLFLPPQAAQEKVPVLYWLSGLTCTDENFVTKAGAQQYASKYGLALVAPDTSPRGEGVADDAEGAWDFGLGAGFYLNATQEPYKKHYQMYDYIVHELYALIGDNFSVNPQLSSIFGHSMGGHGAITIGIKNPNKFQSISAFAPIVAPMQVPWGQKAFSNYLGDDKDAWEAYDSLELIKQSQAKIPPILIDQGSEDAFLTEQLKPELLQAEIKQKNLDIQLNLRLGYDHSYFFISSFIESHFAFHADKLGVRSV